MGSIRRHKNAMSALLAEYHDKISDSEFKDDFDDYPYQKKRREDDEVGGAGGGMCQSIVRYARPQKARSASGEWKYIVNTGQHTQTLRLEKCSNPQESCSYLAQNYRSHCAQVYNYHRLLSWDKTRGLHVDIFKVPTCCSCQIDGYRQQYPPLAGIHHQQSQQQHYQKPQNSYQTSKPKDYSSHFNADLYTNGEELDYQDDDDDNEEAADTLNYPHQFGHGYRQQKHDAPFEPSELVAGSNQVRSKLYAPTPTVGSYLSPPGSDEYDTNYAYKRAQQPSTDGGAQSAAPTLNNLLHSTTRHRRPYYKSLQQRAGNEARVDLDPAPSEQHTDKEVKNYGRLGAQTRVTLHQRKRIYSVPHTATSTFTSSGGPSAPVAAALPAHYAPSSSSDEVASIRNTAHETSATSTAANATQQNAPSYHVNSIYSPAAGAAAAAAPSNAKRINYSYHPIIDFFENSNRAAAAVDSTASATSNASSTSSAPATSSLASVTTTTTTLATPPAALYPHTIPKSTPNTGTYYRGRERRIGYGAGAAVAPPGVENNAWQPVVVEP